METRTDILGRRLRFRPRQPKGKWIEIGPRDLDLFGVIHRHGYLASHYLHAFVGGERNTFQKRLCKLFDWGYLDRFDQQSTSFFNRPRHIIYGLTDKAQQALGDRLVPFYDRTDPFVHRFMGACVGASIELGVQRSWPQVHSPK